MQEGADDGCGSMVETGEALGVGAVVRLAAVSLALELGALLALLRSPGS